MLKLFLPLLLILLIAFPSWGSDLRVYTEITGNTAFYEGEKLTGSSVELVQEIMRRLGESHKIKPVPWIRGYEALSNDANVVLFATTLTDERRPQFQWVGPVLRLQWLFLAQKGKGYLYNNMEDARRAGSIGTYLGDARDQYLTKLGFTNLERAPNTYINYRKLATGRLELVMASNIGVKETLTKAGVELDAVEVAFVVRQMDLYIAFSKKTDPAIVQKWQAAYDSMKEDGTFQRIYRQWYPGMEPPVE